MPPGGQGADRRHGTLDPRGGFPVARHVHELLRRARFGAVVDDRVNAGQVRGPVQLFLLESRSIDPAAGDHHHPLLRHQRARCGQGADDGPQVHRSLRPIPCHGFVSPNLAGDETKGTGFDQGDLDLLFEALCNMFEHDRSAARMEMNPQDLIVFRHENPLGNALAQKLFRQVKVQRNEGAKVPRCFDDYTVTVDEADLPAGVSILRPCA